MHVTLICTGRQTPQVARVAISHICCIVESFLKACITFGPFQLSLTEQKIAPLKSLVVALLMHADCPPPCYDKSQARGRSVWWRDLNRVCSAEWGRRWCLPERALQSFWEGTLPACSSFVASPGGTQSLALPLLS